MDKEQKPDLTRRSLLKAAPLGAHETEHIRNYYRTAAYW